MDKKIQRWSLPLGMAAFGSYVLIMATTSGYKDQSAIFFLLFAFGAGLFHANATRFFSGLTLALFCYAIYSAMGEPVSERSLFNIVVLLIFALVLGVAAIAFFAGHLVRTITRAVQARRIVK